MSSALSGEQRILLDKLVQNGRSWLEDDLSSTLAGRYGIDPDGRIEAETQLTLTNAEAMVRADLVEIIDHLRSDGENEAGSVERLVREAAFTHLNRLVAVRVAEAINLLPETIAQGTASSGFRDFREIAPTIATTEWGRFAAFVRLCADELAADVPALFDPRNPLLELEPSETALKRVVEAIAGLETTLWAAPDTLGWVYQFFNTGEERKQMRDDSPAPRNSRELSVRNQFFTPSYVVDFLVHNGLGAYLASMFPALADDLPLLLARPSEQREIDLGSVSVLDPACGSGHFLLGAYDVLEKAWQHAGVEAGEAAPAIVASLWGVDIDPRVTQIAQTAIVFRARRHCRGGKLPAPNIICARALPEGPAVDELVAALPADVARAVRAVANELVDAPTLGPLLAIEKRLAREARDVFGTGVIEATLSAHMDASGTEATIMAALSTIADSAMSSVAQRLFAAEAHDAVRFVEAMSRRYTIAFTNPPFGQACSSTEGYLKNAYATSWTELYACFVERCLELTSYGVGAITSSTFLTTSRLANYRQTLAARGLASVVDLGAGVLHGATVNTAMLVVAGDRSCSYLDLRSSSKKPSDLKTSVDRRTFAAHDLGVFADLPNSPFAFHASKNVVSLWATGTTLDPAVASVRTGGKTFDNFRYIRAWWELSADALGRGWTWYEKGGEYQPFFAPTRLLLNWKADGAELKEYGTGSGRTAQVMQSSAYWGMPGVCFPRMSSIGFSARTMPAGEIFADTSIAVLPQDLSSTIGILGFLNSTAVAEILSVFGRGRSTENKSVKSLPMNRSWVTDSRIVGLSTALISIFKRLEAARETSPAFAAHLDALDPSNLRRLGAEARRLQETLDTVVESLLALAERVDDSITKRPELNESLFIGEAEDYGLRLLSFVLGIAMGRWPITTRPERDAELLSASSYPLHDHSAPDTTGLLLDQPGHARDIAQRVANVMDQLSLGPDATRAISAVIARRGVRTYIRSRFFADHLNRYSGGGRKAPVYWQLEVPSKVWGVWLYYPKLSRDMLFGIAGEAEQRLRLAEQQIAHLQREAEAGGGGRKASEISAELDAERRLAVELEVFRVEADRIANLGWAPDLDDGAILNAAPLADLFPAWKDAAAYRMELRSGKHSWAAVAGFADRL